MRVLLLQEHCSIAWDWLQLGTEGLAPSTSELSVQCSTFKLRSYSWLGVLLIKRRLFSRFSPLPQETSDPCVYRCFSPTLLPDIIEVSLIPQKVICFLPEFRYTSSSLLGRDGLEPSTLEVWAPCSDQLNYLPIMAPGAGLEPATYRLTAGRSAIELSWNMTPVYRPGDTHSFQLRKLKPFPKLRL